MDALIILEASTARAGKSSDVPWGVSEPIEPSLSVTDGVRRCLLRYDADRGRDGRVDPACNDGRRLTSGDVDADDAGDRCEGGV
jgi:hypothetical protein